MTIYSGVRTKKLSILAVFMVPPRTWQVTKNYSLFVISFDCNWLTDFWTEAFLASKHSLNNTSVLLN